MKTNLPICNTHWCLTKFYATVQQNKIASVHKINERACHHDEKPNTVDLFENKKRISRRKANPPLVENWNNIDGGDFCTIAQRNNSIYCNTTYYDPIYKKKLLYDFTQCKSIQEIGNLLIKCKAERYEATIQTEKIYSHIISNAELDTHFQADNIRYYFKMLQRQNTLREFVYYFFSDEIQKTALENYAREEILKMTSQLRDLTNQCTLFMGSKNHDLSDNLYQTLFSILETFRHSTVFSDPALNDTFSTPTFLSLLYTSYSRYHGTHWFNPVYLQQLAGEQLQQNLNWINSKHYGETLQKSFQFGSNYRLLLTYGSFVEANIVAHDFTASIYYLAKALDYTKQLVNTLFDHEDIDQLRHELDLKNKTCAVVTLEPGWPRIQQLKKRVAYLETQMIDLNVFLDHINPTQEELIEKNLLSALIECKVIYLELQKSFSAKKIELNAREMAFNKNTAEKPKMIAQLEKKNPAPKRIDHATDVVLPGLTCNPLQPTFFSPSTNAQAPTLRIPPAEQKRDKELKTKKFLTTCSLSLVNPENNENKSALNKEYLLDYPLFPKPLPVRFAFDLDKLDNKTLKRIENLIDRARSVGDYGQGIKFVSENEKKSLPFATRNTWLKIKFLGDLGDQLRIYGEVIMENNKQIIIFRHLYDGKVHKQQQRAAKKTHIVSLSQNRRLGHLS